MRIILISIMLSLPALSTTFNIQPVDRQLQEASGVLVGHFLKKKSVRLENGRIATQMVFKAQQEWGMNTDQFGMTEVIVHFPGGQIDEEHSQVQGVPTFVVGEKVAIMTKTFENRYWGLNLGLGTFKVVNYGKKTMLINSLFPEHPEVGQLRLEDFRALVRDIKGEGLKVVRTEVPSLVRAPASVPEGKNRSVASKDVEGENTEEPSGPSTLWLAMILALAGGVYRMRKARII